MCVTNTGAQKPKNVVVLLNKLANNRSDRLLCHCVILMLADRNAKNVSSFKFFLERAFRPAGGHALCLWVVLFVFVIFRTLYKLRETELPQESYCTNKTGEKICLQLE